MMDKVGFLDILFVMRNTITMGELCIIFRVVGL